MAENNSSTENEVALLVHSCDRYAFLFPGFIHFFSSYWNFDIPVNLYFATEDLEVNYPPFKNIRSGKGEC